MSGLRKMVVGMLNTVFWGRTRRKLFSNVQNVCSIVFTSHVHRESFFNSVKHINQSLHPSAGLSAVHPARSQMSVVTLQVFTSNCTLMMVQKLSNRFKDRF